MTHTLAHLLTTLAIITLSHATAWADTTMAQRGRSVDDLVPQGWVGIRSAQADFDKDGLLDLVVIATPDYAANMLQRPADGYVTNCNEPIITFYRGGAEGIYTLWQQNSKIIPAEDEYLTVDYGLRINDKGVVTFTWNLFHSAGSASNDSYQVVFRYQDGDFYLIGRDETSQHRMTGDVVKNSYNYLTAKKQTITHNIFNKAAKKRQRWESLPTMPLKRFADLTDTIDYPDISL